MADRTIVVTLRAETGQYRTAMNEAAGSAEKAGAAAVGAGKNVQSSAQQVEAAGKKVTDSRRQQQDAAARLNTAEKKLDEVKRNSKSSASQVAQAEERVLASRNRLEKATEGLESAEKSHAQAMKVSAQQADQSSSKLQKFANQMEQNKEAWTTAGTALTVMGGAMVGIGLAAGKAGIEFNSLKQTSGAALKSVLGSAEAASAQMDKLNNFGKDSWVMRDVLIRAQQQMTGFGVETKKVIPYLAGLQEAVAAAGGDSQTFEELAGVMAKVKSQGKITAETFNEFGTRGVDAATIIGEQMGKTGQEIRDSVTDGSLDAEVALDALAEGMKTKFAGASDNLRNTFRGSMDNLKAAWRDLSASMAEPIVGPDGGGLGVAALNGLTDAISGVQDKVNELPNTGKTAVLGLGAIASVGTLAAGGFLALAPRIVETKKAFDTLAAGGGILGKATSGIGLLGKLLGVAGAAFAAFQGANWLANKVTKATIPNLEEINSELREMAKNGGELTGAFGGGNAFTDFIGGSQAVNDMGDALEVIGRHAETGTTGWAKFREAITPGTQELEKATEGVKAYDEGFADLVNSGNMDQAAQSFRNIKIPDDMPVAEVMEQFSGYRESLQGVANDLDVTGLKEKDYYEWMRGNVPPAIQEATEAQKQAADGYTGMSEAAVAAQEHLEGVRKGLIDSANGFLDFTAKARESKTTLQEWINDMEKQVEAQASWMDNLSVLAERGAPQALLDQLMSLGPEGAAMVKKLADGSDADMQRVIDVFQKGKKNVNDFANDVAGIPPIDLDADASKLKSQVKTAEGRLKELRKLPTTPEIDAKITLLEDQVKAARSKLKDVENEKTVAKVDADTQPAKDEVTGFKSWFKSHSSVTMSIWAKIKESFDTDDKSPGAKKDKKGNSSRAPMGRATGGPISGPGTGTSDTIPAMLSNGEHVWTAMEVQRAGGHSAIEAMRAAVMSGNNFAGGGAVGNAERRLASAQAQLDSINNASRKVTAEDRRQDRAQARVDEARAAVNRAKEAESRRERLSSLQGELRQDVRRGSIRDQVTGGLSGGYSAVDRLMGLGDNKDLSKGSRSRANSSARKFEANLRSLYSQAEKIDAKLEKAKDKAQELKGIKDSVASGLLNDRDLDVSTSVVSTGDGNFKQVSSMSSMTGKTARLKELVNKLGKLSKMGIPGALLQEVAGQGIEGGNAAADALLGAPIGERNQLVSSWAEFDKYAGQAGQYVTEGFYKGGANAANGVVKGLEGRKKNVESAIANLAKVMESTFKSVLGIHSPSTVMAELGGFTAEGLVQGMLSGVSDVQSAASMLGSAAVPALGDMSTSVDVGVNPVVADDEGMAGLAMQDMSTTTLDAMEQMRVGVSDGWAAMLLNMQETQAGMLLGTQTTNAGQLLDTQTQQAAMLLNTQTQNAAMLLDVQTQQEAMRLNVATKQAGQKTVATEQQELMRLMLIDKQSQMKTKSAEDFESLKLTTGSKFSGMRSATDTTMSGMYGDYSGRLSDLKTLNKSGFESLLGTSNANMRAVRSGMDDQMEAAKPELGGNLNALIRVFASFTSSVNKAFGDVGVKLDAPAPLKFADGGVMPGYSPGRDIHHFRSQSAGDLYLSGGEGILRPETTRMIGGEKGIHALNSAARTGNSDALTHMLGGMAFADGGVVPRIPGVNAFADSGVWRNLWAITKEKFPNATLNSAYRGGSITASGNLSHHARGNAIDTSPSMDIFNFWRNTYGSDLAELIYSPANGKQIKNGQNYMYTGAVRGMHFNHVHIAAVKALSEAMAGGLPGMGGEMSHPFLDRAGVKPGDNMAKSYEAAAKKLTEQIYSKHAKMLPDGYMGGLGKGIMSQVSEGLVGKAKDYGKNAGSADFSNVAAGPVKTMAKQMLEQMGWGDQFGDLNWLLTRESGWNPNAQNPSSSAYGLFQFLNGTWGTVGGSKTSDPKMQLEYGLKYIKQRYGDVQGARSFWERNHWYEQGTDSAKSGWAVVGENGPELVNLSGGEQIHNAAESRKLLAENRTFIPHTGGGFDVSAIGSSIAAEIKNNQFTPSELAKALDGVPVSLVVDGKQMQAHISTTVSGIAVGAGRAH
ncbi:MAG: tape measure protein [Brevibacterium sp.]|nr:tape measure protein [Brevibacterium sp.]